MAPGLNEMGVTRRNGAPISADSLRKTWAEVCRVEAARRKEDRATTHRSAAADPHRPASGAADPPEFAPARLRSGYRANDTTGSKGGKPGPG